MYRWSNWSLRTQIGLQKIDESQVGRSFKLDAQLSQAVSKFQVFSVCFVREFNVSNVIQNTICNQLISTLVLPDVIKVQSQGQTIGERTSDDYGDLRRYVFRSRGGSERQRSDDVSQAECYQ